MSPRDYAWELQCSAEMIFKAAEDVSAALKAGDLERARERLGQCKSSAQIIELRFADVEQALAQTKAPQ